MNEKKIWADEPTPQTNPYKGRWAAYWHDGVPIFNHACELERRLRYALKLVGKLRADADCGDFDKGDLEQRLAAIEEVLSP